MHEYSPLRAIELRVIEDSLNVKDFEKAQVLLGQVGTQQDLQTGVAYLATRLLFLRGRLDAASVIERMRELVGANPHFDEARVLMEHCKRLLQATGSEPPSSLTPRPGSLFPSAPPPPPSASTTGDTSPAYVSPLPDARVESFLGSDDEAPESWPVPGFEALDPIQDEDRPTFVPEGETVESRPTEDALLANGLARTEYPGPLPSDQEPLLAGVDLSRQIRVDTRDSLLPTPPSIPPPSRYDPTIPKPEGRYSVHDSSDELVLPKPSAAPLAGRYRLSKPVVEEVVVSSVRPRRSDAAASRRTKTTQGPSPSSNAARRAGQAATPPANALDTEVGVELPPEVAVSSKPPGTLPSATTAVAIAPAHHEHLELGMVDEPTPFRVPRPSSGAPPSSQDPPLSYAWNDPERQFERGDPSAARARFEQKALDLLEPYPTDFTDFPDKVTEIARVLSTAPVVQYFAPYDRSLCSLARVELAVRTLYGGASVLPIASVRPALALYVGEVLRMSHRGSWRGVPERPSTWAVEAGAHIWQPLKCIAQILTDTPGQSLLQSVGSGLAKRGTLAWMSADPGALPLSRPWHDPLTPPKQAELGTWLCSSPWSVCCDRAFGQPLDGSLQSLKALDRLLDFLCDSAESPKATAPWLVRTATLAGAYVGVVLTGNANAQWVERTSNTEQGIALELPGGIIATPVANVVARATSRKRSQLADYVRALMRRSV